MQNRIAAPARRSTADTQAASRLRPLAWSRRGDHSERDAEALAASVFGRTQGPDSSGDTRLENQGTTTTPLAAETRAFFEPRFGHDFSRVRVRAGGEATAAARRAGARAYTIGHEIVWGGPAHPDSPKSRRLLAHELAHIAAGHTVAARETAFRDEPQLPTEEQQRNINRLFNPQQSQGPDVPQVTDPAGFKTALKARAANRRAVRLTGAQAVQASPVSLSTSDLTDVTTIAENRLRTTFQSYLAPGIDLSAIRSRIRYIPSDPGTAPAVDEVSLSAAALGSLDFSAVDTAVMGDGPSSTPGTCQEIIERFHVLPGGRDKGLYNDTLGAIRDEAPVAWRTIALSFRGWDSPDMPPVLQRHIKPEGGEAQSTTRRRGRWLNLGTSIHEILHAVTHRDFANATFAAESRRLGTEGFTEFFTRQVYATIVSDAAGDPVLRLSIEGAPGPPPITPPPRTSYEAYFQQVQEIIEILGNEENLRQAYFHGRVEFIGLGQWNELHRGLPTTRRHALGAAVLFRTSGGAIASSPYLRADWGYLVLGGSGAVQLDLRVGAGLTFVSEGDRLGFGPQITGTVRGGHLFLTGGALVQGSASLAGGFNDPRLDAAFRIEAGAQFGRFHLGPTVEVLVPINEPDAAKRSAQVYAGLGASFVFGR